MFKIYKFQHLVCKTHKIRGIKTNEYKSTGKYPVIDQGNKFIAGYTDNEEILYKDALPVVVFGDHTLAIKFVDFPFCVGADGTQILKPNNEIIIGKFLYYSILKLNIKSLGYSRHFKVLKEATFRIPEIKNQKRIIRILDKADELRQKRKQAIGLLDDYLKSVFLDMFGDLNANDKSWEYLEFGNYISILTDYHANGSYEILKKNVTLLDEPNYALMVRTTDLENNNFEKDVKYIDEHAYNYLEKSKVYGGEIIINKIGSAGKVYLMPKLNRPVSLGMNAFLLRFNDNANVIFMYYLLTSHYGETIIQKKVKGAVTKTIRKDAIRSLKVPNITIDLQNEFSDIYIKTNRLKQSMLTQSAELEAQFQVLMQKAFNGGL